MPVPVSESLYRANRQFFSGPSRIYCRPPDSGDHGGQVAFKQGTLERRHLENLPLASFAQIFTQAKENYPEMHTAYYPLEDALLVALTASEPRHETR